MAVLLAVWTHRHADRSTYQNLVHKLAIYLLNILFLILSSVLR